MKHVKSCIKNKRIGDCIDYDFWCHQIVSLFNAMFDHIVIAADKSGTYASCLAILKYASTNFSEGFMQHTSSGFNLNIRIAKVDAALKEYNSSSDSWFEDEGYCVRLKKQLDNLKQEESITLYGYVSRFGNALLSRRRSAPTTKRSTSSYKRKVERHQSSIECLLKDFAHALHDHNYELVTKYLQSLNIVDKTLYMHLHIPLQNVDKHVLAIFKAFLNDVRNTVLTKDMRLLDQHFSDFYLFRQMLGDNHLLADKQSLESASDMHADIADIINSCKLEFQSMCSEFKFDNALNLVDLMKGIRQFIDSTSTRSYCIRFSCSSFMSTFSETKTSRYTRTVVKYTDKGLKLLGEAISNFPQPTEISKSIMQLHSSMIGVVKDSANNHEYFKLKAISAGLTNFHLLADIGGGSDLINGTKQTIQNIIKGSLDALRQDVSTYWNENEWSKLNDAIKILREAEEELKHFSGFIDTSLLYNIQQELDKKLTDIASEAINIAIGNSGDLNERIRDFAIKLSNLGRVYDQVQVFHNLAKIQIHRVLNHCREQLGFSFIFKLGVILEEGSVFDTESDPAASVRIGKRMITDFSHFKDVATMSWNKNVAQIPVDESMRDMQSYTYDDKTKTKTDYGVDKAALLVMYEEYKNKYEELILIYLPTTKDEAEIVDMVRQRVQTMQPCTLASWNDSKKKEIPFILAGIFAYFTVSKCGESFNSIGESDDADAVETARQILITPHNIQVLTILRLLGCGDSSASMQNQLMQIGTGEGKSIILGALATIFGLLNFPVRCVCYSEYLSSRDYSDFKDIFIAFQCQQNIVYSKITTYSEDSIAAQGNIRQLTQDMILGNNSSGRAPDHSEEEKLNRSPKDEVVHLDRATDEVKNDVLASTAEEKAAPSRREEMEEVPRKKTPGQQQVLPFKSSGAPLPILLVDEVDVFFGKDFYGQTYNQVTHISTPEVIALIRMIWKERSSKPSLRSLTALPEYQTLVTNFKDWGYLIDNELKLMCSQVNNFNKPAYVYDPQSDRVGYSEHDTINYSLTYGYRTIFAYLRELDNGNVKSTHTANFDQQHLHMQVSCGQFSYANINPACILGVSGTLTALTTYEQDVMSRYKIDQYSVSPSVYGKKDLVFDHADAGIAIADDKADYFKGIVNVINNISRTSDSSKRKNRAVIVFFESFSRLEEFRKSDYFRQVIENTGVNRLSELTGTADRDYIIRKAATMGQVTLATKAFGRGTDFISRDDPLNKLGGTHILQTFLSEMLTEEIQIKGRTSRQGQKGSYGTILLMQDELVEEVGDGVAKPKADTLEYFGINSTEMNNQGRADRYQYLCDKRTVKRATESIEIEENLKTANERDLLTRAYFKSLLSHNHVSSCTLFNEIYLLFKGAMTTSVHDGVHVIFMLDESGSMCNDFGELRSAYWNFIKQRLGKGASSDDRMSVIMFGCDARPIAKLVSFSDAPDINYGGGGTSFGPPLSTAEQFLTDPASRSLMPILLLMTDGCCGDEGTACSIMKRIDNTYKDESLQVHFVAFGQGASIECLEQLKCQTTDGYIHTSQMGELATTFKDIEQSLMVAEYN
jgi:hypothetical protein